MPRLLFALLLLPTLTRAQGEIGYDQIVVVTAAVEHYDGWDDLPGARKDVELFHKALDGPWDAPIQVVHLDDATATREGILTALDQAATEAGKRERSLLIFYFAGHGETRKEQGYIVPAGAKKEAFSTWLSVDELKSASANARAVSHQLFILGSCFGGKLIKHRASLTVKELSEVEAAATWRAGELANVARVALVAGNDKQKLPDGTPKEGSKFGRALATALRWSTRGRAADYNRDGCVDRDELASYVSAHGRTPDNSPRQGPLPDDEAGILALCKGRFNTPPKVESWGASRGGPQPGQEMAPETKLRPAMLYIPPGSFVMGSPKEELGRDDDEAQRPVSFKEALWMMRTEVTQGQWQAVMGDNPSYFEACGPTCPVEQVTWYEALSYANALSLKEQLTACYHVEGCKEEPGKLMECAKAEQQSVCNGYRLPTEAEWEYAARAGTQTAIYAGPLTIAEDGKAPALDPIAWWDGDNSDGTRPVGGRKANPWGLHDMLGNVWEWNEDFYPNQTFTADDYQAMVAAVVASGQVRFVRGGSWSSGARRVRAAVRLGRHPGGQFPSQGFRLVRRPVAGTP